MGREWLYKATGGGDGGSHGGRRSVKPPSATATANKPMNRRKPKDKNASSSGCMSVIFNLFDIQHHQFRFHHPSFMLESTMTNDGIEAPRNSFESPESAIDVAPSESKAKEQTNLNIPVGRIQIKTKRSRFMTDDISSECSNSPSTKTPNLVARLMGLDLLPEYSSPRPSSSSTPANPHHHSRSLPATPRLSTASRRSTDNDYHHRLSLQIDKENCNSCRGHERRRSEQFRRKDENNDRKTQYAKEITNQVRERISRRLGTDITNTGRRRDSDLVLVKPKKYPARESPVKSKLDDSTPLSSSKKLNSVDIRSNFNKPISNSHSSSIKEVKSKAQTLKLHGSPEMKPEKPVKGEKIKRIESERYDLRLKKMNQQKDVIVGKKKKSNALPKHVLNVKNTTKFLSFKKEMASSSSTARSSQLQVSLPSLNSSYKSDDTHHLKPPTTTTAAAATTTFSDHFNYISRILNHRGITSTAPISTVQWHSHSHPIHPSTFHHLENLHHPTTTTTATRRLIFDLVNESLVEILKPYMNQRPPPESCLMYGSDLIAKVCEMIGGFPAVHCEVLEDIDGLIEGDLGRWLVATAVEAEAEEMVAEMESEIVGSLVHELVWSDRG